MARLDRRTFLLLAAVAPLIAPSVASAGFKIPTRSPPRRVLPLGSWRVIDKRPTAGPGETISVELAFRSLIDVDEPFYNWWPRTLAARLEPANPTPTPTITPTAAQIERRCRRVRTRAEDLQQDDEPFPEPLPAGVWTPVLVPVEVPTSVCTGIYVVTVQMIDRPPDPAALEPQHTRRRALTSFRLRVIA